MPLTRAELLRRARERDVTLRIAKFRDSPYLYGPHGLSLPLPLVADDETLPPAVIHEVCDYFGFDPTDFGLDPEDC